MNNRSIAHEWANNPQKDRKASNLFCESGTIYSYGRHFPIATIRSETDETGRSLCLFTIQRYSVTTAKHCSYVRQALPASLRVIYVDNARPDSKEDHSRNLSELLARTVKAHETADKAKGYAQRFRYEPGTWERIPIPLAEQKAAREESRVAAVAEKREHAESLLGDCETYARAFKLRFRKPENLDALAEANRKRLAAEAKAAERARKKQAAERAEREADQRRIYAEEFAEWQRGTRHHVPSVFYVDAAGSAYLRVRENPDKPGELEFQTSRGAIFPVKPARVAFRLIETWRANAKPGEISRPALRVGSFTLDEIDASGNVHAGCHFLSWERIREGALLAGFIDE